MISQNYCFKKVHGRQHDYKYFILSPWWNLLKCVLRHKACCAWKVGHRAFEPQFPFWWGPSNEAPRPSDLLLSVSVWRPLIHDWLFSEIEMGFSGLEKWTRIFLQISFTLYTSLVSLKSGASVWEISITLYGHWQHNILFSNLIKRLKVLKYFSCFSFS